VAPQSVISEILNGKREINLKQAKGFAEYFRLPVGNFIE
jgi:HTH-type transcriptional regulator/antitoxin HigA